MTVSILKSIIFFQLSLVAAKLLLTRIFLRCFWKKRKRVVLSYQLSNNPIILQRFVFGAIPRREKFVGCIFTRIYSNIYYILMVFFNLFQREVSFSSVGEVENNNGIFILFFHLESFRIVEREREGNKKKGNVL